ncbi:MAG: hypothetical protein HZB77_03025 [Chloroflexi bacterium]|nr:hypothetical protein [Chloroflexota bacterium]
MNLFLIFIQIGAAIISSPAQGQTIRGQVSISGSATHPQFVRYEIAFAYDPNPTETWFEIQTSTTPIATGALATWDTRGLTDGLYMIRLRVYSKDSTKPEEAIVRRIQIGNAITPTPVASASAAVAATLIPTASAPTTATPLPPTPTLSFIPAPTRAPIQFDPTPYGNSFCGGSAITFFLFAILGLYAALRDRIRRPIRRWWRRVGSDIKKP